MARNPPLTVEAPWVVLRHPEDDWDNSILSLPGVGFVSLSFRLRRWWLGYSEQGHLPYDRNQPTYEGRGWRSRLIADAQHALEALR